MDIMYLKSGTMQFRTGEMYAEENLLSRDAENGKIVKMVLVKKMNI